MTLGETLMTEMLDKDPWLDAVKNHLVQLIAMQKRVEQTHEQQTEDARQHIQHSNAALEKLYGVVNHMNEVQEKQEQTIEEAKVALILGQKQLKFRLTTTVIAIALIPLFGLYGAYHFLSSEVVLKQQQLVQLTTQLKQTPVVIDFEGEPLVKIQQGTTIMLENNKQVAAYAKLSK